MQQNRSNWVYIGTILVLFVMVLILGALALFLIFRQPLGEPMALTATTPMPTSPLPTLVGAVQATATTAAPEKSKPVETGTCGNTGSLTILFTGADLSSGKWPLGADAVRVVKFNFDTKQMTVVAFPRDLWVRTVGLEDQNMASNRLGLAYYYKRDATQGEEKHRNTVATTLIGQTLYDNFDVAPQNYLTIQLDSVSSMVDAIGGIELNNPTEFTSEYGVKFVVGQQLMDGSRAKEYVRDFSQGDAARRQRQNLFIEALQDKILTAGTLAKMPELVKQFDKSIVTDLSPKQLNDLACMAQAVPQDQVFFYEISGDLVTTRSDGALLPKVDVIKSRIKEWLGN